MRLLRTFFGSQERHFTKGGKLERFYPLFEAMETLAFTPASVTKGSVHVRDALDLKRMMIVVVAALLPTVVMAMYNTGLQAHRAIAAGAEPLARWQTSAFEALGFEYSMDFLAGLIHGALYFLPVFVVGFAVGGGISCLDDMSRVYTGTLASAVPIYEIVSVAPRDGSGAAGTITDGEQMAFTATSSIIRQA